MQTGLTAGFIPILLFPAERGIAGAASLESNADLKIV